MASKLLPRFTESDRYFLSRGSARVSIGETPESRDVSRLVAVRVRLVRAVHGHVDVLGLLLRENGKLRAERAKVEPGNLLVELLRKQVHLVGLVLPAVALLPELELREGLVRERARHTKEGW